MKMLGRHVQEFLPSNTLAELIAAFPNMSQSEIDHSLDLLWYIVLLGGKDGIPMHLLQQVFPDGVDVMQKHPLTGIVEWHSSFLRPVIVASVWRNKLQHVPIQPGRLLDSRVRVFSNICKFYHTVCQKSKIESFEEKENIQSFLLQEENRIWRVLNHFRGEQVATLFSVLKLFSELADLYRIADNKDAAQMSCERALEWFMNNPFDVDGVTRVYLSYCKIDLERKNVAGAVQNILMTFRYLDRLKVADEHLTNECLLILIRVRFFLNVSSDVLQQMLNTFISENEVNETFVRKMALLLSQSCETLVDEELEKQSNGGSSNIGDLLHIKSQMIASSATSLDEIYWQAVDSSWKAIREFETCQDTFCASQMRIATVRLLWPFMETSSLPHPDHEVWNDSSCNEIKPYDPFIGSGLPVPENVVACRILQLIEEATCGFYRCKVVSERATSLKYLGYLYRELSETNRCKDLLLLAIRCFKEAKAQFILCNRVIGASTCSLEAGRCFILLTHYEISIGSHYQEALDMTKYTVQELHTQSSETAWRLAIRGCGQLLQICGQKNLSESERACKCAETLLNRLKCMENEKQSKYQIMSTFWTEQKLLYFTTF